MRWRTYIDDQQGTKRQTDIVIVHQQKCHASTATDLKSNKVSIKSKTTGTK